MDVRVCGPNLRDQSKGTFHVHIDGCPDLRKYGPQYRGRDGKGGDLDGNREMLVENATVLAVVYEVYADQIAEAKADGNFNINSYINDFWFAPCCEPWMEHGSEPTDSEKPETIIYDVFECWIQDDVHSFAKLRIADQYGVAIWVLQRLATLQRHQHLHIVRHSSDEYSGTRFVTED